MQPPDERFPRRDEIVVIDDAAEVDIDLTTDDIAVLHDADADDHAASTGDTDVVEVIDEPGPEPVAPRRPPVDPRIRARRIAVAREQGRRRLRVVMVVLSVVVVAGTAWLIVQSPILDVDHIVVTGVPQARVAAVVAATGVHRHDPLLLVSASAVEHRVERVPGIGSVHVSREFPGTLHVSARQQGVALWARAPAGGVVLVGFDGRIQRAAPVPPPGVIELRGLTRVPTPGRLLPVARVVDVMAQLPPTLRVRIGAISATTADDVRVYLIVGGQIRLGDLTSLHDKGIAAEAVLEQMGCAIDYVDVQSISNPVARPAPGATCNPP